MPRPAAATVESLYHLPHGVKAELVGGELLIMSPTGDFPASSAGEIFASLHRYSRRKKRKAEGRAYTDNTGFLVHLPNRESFAPDVSFYAGPRSQGKFLAGAPLFAAEVRSEGDYGPKAEREIRAKRNDYFAAGTIVVWDVDVLRDNCVRSYRSVDPDNPLVFRPGDIAHAEPALPGWKLPVDRLFEAHEG